MVDADGMMSLKGAQKLIQWAQPQNILAEKLGARQDHHWLIAISTCEIQQWISLAGLTPLQGLYLRRAFGIIPLDLIKEHQYEELATSLYTTDQKALSMQSAQDIAEAYANNTPAEPSPAATDRDRNLNPLDL